MLASRKTLLHLYLMYIYATTLWQRLFIMQCMLWVLKQNFLLSDAVSIKLAATITYQKLLSLLISFTLQRRYLTVNPIYISSIWQPFFMNYVNSSLKTKTIQSNSGSVLAVLIGDSTRQLTRIQNHSILNLYFQVEYLGTITKKSTVITSSVNGRWHFKYQIEKGGTFST